MNCKVCDFLYEKLKKAEDRVKELETPFFIKIEEPSKKLNELSAYLEAVEENYRKMAERVKAHLFEEKKPNPEQNKLRQVRGFN